jgi:hypothetical protein
MKVVPLTVAGAKGLLKIAATAELPGTPGVGPGMVVSGIVDNTRGRVASAGDATVVNVHANGAVIAKPLALPLTPLMVAV